MERIQANYHFIKELGAGGYARVHLAEHRRTKLLVAIKVISISERRNDSAYIDRIDQEVNLMKKMNHPFICELFEVVVEPGQCYFIVMEYLEGGTLLERLNTTGSIAESTAKNIFFQLVSAVYYIHRFNIVHRDIKIENILFDHARNIRLIDFGLSCLKKEEGSLMHTKCGSMSYAAPEMIKGEEYSSSVDIWSMGIVLYAMLTGELPFKDENTQKLMQNIVYNDPIFPQNLSRGAIDLLQRMLTKDSKSRITIPDILKHPWVHSAIFPLIVDFNSIDPEILKGLEMYGYDSREIESSILNNLGSDGVIAYKIAHRAKLMDQIKSPLAQNSRKVSSLKTRNVPISPFIKNGQIMPLMKPPIVMPRSVRRQSFSAASMIKQSGSFPIGSI
ncbi:CAMK family protein kinase [Tritrichomonas foetus]|uniref:non-specific serine/threonine protein kinase n=1 Tax=Tritrichomonas foetus TaxID=1144522 RepID=A0A1J4KQ88_9EUKA|nr:CAMK family protein kinase [Tritrichomonas foetus]|eukprot:OHT11956.1 CAMK family protein kinase [Tritrichomonas foetus]